jgi:cytoskeletal protein RodZ
VLRERREACGLTLDDVARTTKIAKGVLRAIESGDALHLPAPIYTRGFLKAYAIEVGLDPERAADDYLGALERLHPAEHDGRAANHDRERYRNASPRQFRRIARLVGLAAAVGLVAYVASFNTRQELVPATPSDIGEEADTAPAENALAVDAAPAADVAHAALGDAPLRIEIVPQAPCWLSARVDGERVIAKLLKPGERQTIDVNDEAVLRIGEPGALSFSINGQSGRPFGPAGQPVTVRITRANFREFLSS